MSCHTISYHYLGTVKPMVPIGTRGWLSKAVALEGGVLREWGIIFCTDACLLEMNAKHLKHNTYTDILTFDYTAGARIVGESYISYCRIQANAKQYQVSVAEELCRVMLHGLLHVCGYADTTADEKKRDACGRGSPFVSASVVGICWGRASCFT